MPPQHFINTNYTLARCVCCFISHDNSSIKEEMLPFFYKLYNYYLKTINKHSLEMVQLLRALTLLPQDRFDAQHLHGNSERLCSRGCNIFFWTPRAAGTHMIHRHNCIQNTHTHKKINKHNFTNFYNIFSSFYKTIYTYSLTTKNQRATQKKTWYWKHLKEPGGGGECF